MSTPDLLTNAAHSFLLAEQVYRLDWYSRNAFWEMSASAAVEAVTHLPALTVAVREEYKNVVLHELARHPLPVRLSPESVPWYDALVAAWEIHRSSTLVDFQNPARRALVRLDGCGMPDGVARPSRLPEWLAEARKIASGAWRVVKDHWLTTWADSGHARTRNGGKPQAYDMRWVEFCKLKTLDGLAALADWHPAPGVITPPETLREWMALWQEVRQSSCPLRRGIAAKALLNLPEADLRAASLQPVPPEQLLRDLAAAIRAAAERASRNGFYHYLYLLDWQPAQGTVWPAAEVKALVNAWLEVTSNIHRDIRHPAWWQLIRWDRAGSLATCGGSMLSMLASAAYSGKPELPLWEMAQWRPATEAFTATLKHEVPDLLRRLEIVWQGGRRYMDLLGKKSAWLGSIRLHQAGLASEPPESFLEAYLSAVAQEDDGEALLVLAQWSPGAEAPAAFHRKWRQGWQSRLREKDEEIRQTALFALLRQALGNGTGEGLRRVALEGWRTGTNEGQAARQMLDTVLFRFHEVRAQLAAGRVPDFGKEPAPPAQQQYPRVALPPGHIAEREWRMENGELKIENCRGRSGTCP